MAFLLRTSLEIGFSEYHTVVASESLSTMNQSELLAVLQRNLVRCVRVKFTDNLNFKLQRFRGVSQYNGQHEYTPHHPRRFIRPTGERKETKVVSLSSEFFDSLRNMEVLEFKNYPWEILLDLLPYIDVQHLIIRNTLLGDCRKISHGWLLSDKIESIELRGEDSDRFKQFFRLVKTIQLKLLIIRGYRVLLPMFRLSDLLDVEIQELNLVKIHFRSENLPIDTTRFKVAVIYCHICNFDLTSLLSLCSLFGNFRELLLSKCRVYLHEKSISSTKMRSFGTICVKPNSPYVHMHVKLVMHDTENFRERLPDDYIFFNTGKVYIILTPCEESTSYFYRLQDGVFSDDCVTNLTENKD